MRTIDIGSHRIKIVKLGGEKSSSGNTFFVKSTTEISSDYLPYAVQYRGNKEERSDIYSAVAKWALELGASSIGGPILSGAVLAEGISARSKSLLPFYISKKPGYYKPYKHTDENVKGCCRGDYVIVDDIISSGNSMEFALRNVRRDFPDLDRLKAILVFSGEFDMPAKKYPILKSLIEEGKLFSLYCSNRRRRK